MILKLDLLWLTFVLGNVLDFGYRVPNVIPVVDMMAILIYRHNTLRALVMKFIGSFLSFYFWSLGQYRKIRWLFPSTRMNYEARACLLCLFKVLIA